MPTSSQIAPGHLYKDLTAGVVVSLVAVPLCLGIALASNAPLISGLLSGIIGGVLVGMVSRSPTSVSGPAAALAAIVATEIAALGSFQTFQLAVVIAGTIQVVLGLARAGAISAFIPSSVINGLLAAIGILLILKQIPHLVGHDVDPEGEMAFFQPDKANTFTELLNTFGHIHFGAMTIGLASLGVMILWQRLRFLSQSGIPAPLAVVAFGMLMSGLFQQWGAPWTVQASHLVQVPVPEGLAEVVHFLQWPDFSQATNPRVYTAAITIALAASLATLLNLESVDKLDPRQRRSPPSREIFAQGIGNMASGLIGGLPMTSEIIRGSVNVNAGAQSKLAAIIHGLLLSGSILLIPRYLNMIPLSCLAAILIMTGARLANPVLVRRMWDEGRYQFFPFLLTVLAIVFTDLLKGVIIGLVISIGFILNSNLRRPIRRIMEKHLSGDVLRIELANQVSFLNRAALATVLDEIPSGGHVLLDAHSTDYIDPDVLTLIRDFKDHTAPARNITVSMSGFRKKYQFRDELLFQDFSTRELQKQLAPSEVLNILKGGHERFRRGERLTRDLSRQMQGTARRQHPLAVVLSCIDSRAPTELIFDLGLGDILSARVAGNILTPELLGSMEYACAIAKARLIVVMGHTRCGAVTSALEFASSGADVAEVTGCANLPPIVAALQQSMDPAVGQRFCQMTPAAKDLVVTDVVYRNVQLVAEAILEQSPILSRLHQSGEVGIVGAVYDVTSGEITFLPHPESCIAQNSEIDRGEIKTTSL